MSAAGQPAGARHQFHVLSPEVLEMDSQMRALGGSRDARVAQAQVWVRVCPTGAAAALSPGARGREEGGGIVSAEGEQLAVRDPREPADAPLDAQGHVRRFRVSGTFPPSAGQLDVHRCVGLPAVEWVFDGFNTAFVSFGQVSTGKTYTAFGGAAGQRTWRDQGLCSNMIASIFERASSAAEGRYTVAMSCFEVLNNSLFDLLAYPVAASPPGSGAQDVGRVRVESLGAAMKVLERARACSSCWAPAADRCLRLCATGLNDYTVRPRFSFSKK